MKRLLIAAALASWYAHASPAGQAELAKREPEFVPRKAYRECLNRNFVARFREGNVPAPEAIAEETLLACRREERALAALAEELLPLVKDRMKAFLVSGGHVPENLWWP
jgi:hypothetical protein